MGHLGGRRRWYRLKFSVGFSGAIRLEQVADCAGIGQQPIRRHFDGRPNLTARRPGSRLEKVHTHIAWRVSFHNMSSMSGVRRLREDKGARLFPSF